MEAMIKVKPLEKMNLAYVSHKGNFSKIGDAYGMLMGWAGQKGLLNNPEIKRVTIYHDNPKAVGEENVRQSACLVLNNSIETDAGIEKRQTSAGDYAIGRFEIGFEDFGKAWESVFTWINENGKSHNEGDCFEIFHNNYMIHPEKKCIIDICVPIL